MYTAYVFTLFGASLLFLQRAIQIALDARILNRKVTSVPVFWLAFVSFLYSAVFFLSLQPHGKAAGYAINCSIGIILSLAQLAYISSFSEYLGLPRKTLRGARIVFAAMVPMFLVGWALWQFFGLEVILYDRPNPYINDLLIRMGLDLFTPTPLTLVSELVFMIALIQSQLKILGAIRRQGHRDPILVFGVLFSFAAIANEIVSGSGFFKHGISVMFLADALQLYRISSVLRRDAQRRIESLERDVVALTPVAHLGLFVGAIAHDIRNPLSVVNSCSQVLAERLARTEAPDPVFMRELVTSVRSSADRMGGIVNQYLKLAQGDEVLRAERVSLKQVTQGALELSQRKFRALGNPAIEVEVPEDLSAAGNPLLLELLLTNLLTNAAQAVAGRPEPRIRLNAAEDGDHCRIEVRDNGPGILPENRAKLFTQIWTTRLQGQGTGLGLRIVGQIVQRHGGKIRLRDDTAETCFEVLLPRSRG